jgi:hypothetical protein
MFDREEYAFKEARACDRESFGKKDVCDRMRQSMYAEKTT